MKKSNESPMGFHLRSVVRDRVVAARHSFAADSDQFSIVVGVSGGQDSMVLLDVLSTLAVELSLRLVVAHFDHALRPDSKTDASFVRTVAEKYSLPCVVERVPDSEMFSSNDSGDNVEAWARSARYDFFERVRQAVGAQAIVTAHHQSDQAETLLLRLLSGRLLTSSHSAAAIDPTRLLFRPLLECSKKDIIVYAEKHGLQFREDETNNDSARLRNRLRHELIPQLIRDYNPALVESLGRLAERLSIDETELWRQAARTFDSLADHSPQSFAELSPAMRYRVLSLLLREHCGEAAARVGYRALTELANHLEHPPSAEKMFQLGFGYACRVSAREGICFFVENDTKRSAAAVLGPERLMVPGMVQRCYENGAIVSISARLLEHDDIIDTYPRLPANADRSGIEYFDAEQLLATELFVRERQDGDEMQVWRRGRRKLKKLFSERRLRLTLRDQVPIVESGGRIIWVPGIARSEFAPVTGSSRQVVELSCSCQCVGEGAFGADGDQV